MGLNNKPSFFLMTRKRFLDVVGTVLLGTGFFFAFLPHTTHVAAGFDGETSHLEHIAVGITLVIAGLGVLVYNNKAWKGYKR